MRKLELLTPCFEKIRYPQFREQTKPHIVSLNCMKYFQNKTCESEIVVQTRKYESDADGEISLKNVFRKFRGGGGGGR